MPTLPWLRALPLLPLVATLSLPAQTAVSPQSTGPAAATSVPPSAAPTPHATVPPAEAITASSQRAARRAYDRGAAALRKSDFDRAAQEFAAAVKDDPTRPEYYQGLSLAQESHLSSLLHAAAKERTSHPLAAEHLLAEARGIDPSNPRITQHDMGSRRDTSARTNALDQLKFVPAGAITTRASNAIHSFHEKTDTRAFAQEVGRVYGLRVAFDADLQSKSFRIDLDDADYATAMDVLSTVANVFPTPVDEHTILIAADTTAKRKQFEHLLQEIVPLPGYSAEQINEAASMLRSVFDLQDQRSVQASPQLGALLLRVPEGTLHAMDTVLTDLIDSGSEVVVDVKLYSVEMSKARNLGVVLPTSFTLFSARSEIQNVLNSNASVVQQLIANGVIPPNATQAEIAAYLIFVAGLGSSYLQNTVLLFGGGLSALGTSSSSFGLTPLGLALGSFPSVNFALQKSDAITLDDLQLRVADRATAVFKAGIRYPIQTAIFSSGASSTTGNGLAALLARFLGSSQTNSLANSATIPQFQYQDLGLTVNATPRVMNGDEVAVHLEFKLSALSGASINGVPVLASRQFDSTLQMRDGQTMLMTSQVQDSEAAVITGIPGINELPGLHGGTNRQTNTAHTNLVLMITPHIVRHAHDIRKGPYIPLPSRPDDE